MCPCPEEEYFMGRIVCFGNSNTYGYDPVTMRYGAENRWPDLLAQMQDKEVVNMGLNGREIPSPWYAEKLADAVQPDDLLLVMLGSNDLLLEGRSAAEAAASMKAFLLALPAAFWSLDKAAPEIILISPPPMTRGFWVTADSIVQESELLADHYEELADSLDIGFLDAGKWGVELTFDGVHFTEAGHHAFADGIAAAII